MNIVNESSLGNIKSVFNDNATNAHYYKIIDKIILGTVKDLEFAKPIIQVNKGTISWQSKLDGPYHSYASLPQEKKAHVDNLIQNALNTVSSLIEKDKDSAFFENIIEIPSEDAILYTKDTDNKIKVILTEWGYTKDEHIRKEGFLKKIFSTPKSFIVKFRSGKNEPLEDISAHITSDNLDFRDASNNAGLIKLNNLKKSSTIKISSPDKKFEEVSVKLDTKEEHTIIIQREFTLTFKVITSNNEPVAKADFDFKSDFFKNKKFKTADNGHYSFQHPENVGDFEVYSKEGDKLLNENLPSQDQTYTLVYDPPIEEVEEKAVIVPPKAIEEKEEIEEIEEAPPEIPADKIELEFLDWRKKPITQQSVDIYGQKGKQSYITDENGIIPFDVLDKEIKHGIFMDYKGAGWKNEFTHIGNTKYTFIVKRRRVLWWWLPMLLFFLILLLIPTEVKHHYTVLDKNTKQPLSSAEISSTEASIYKVQDYQDKTDSLGKLSISYGNYAIYKQLFKKPTTDVFAKKSGYESLQAKVPLGFFKTRESIIYLSKLPPPQLVPVQPAPTPQPDPIEPDPIEPDPERTDPIEDCNSGGDAGEQGENSILEYDLKKSQGTFVFKYYLGDRIPDEVIIYDCPKSEINSHKPIFRVDETTQMPKSVNLPFTNRIITVVVNGRGNIDSIWEYVVECPR